MNKAAARADATDVRLLMPAAMVAHGAHTATAAATVLAATTTNTPLHPEVRPVTKRVATVVVALVVAADSVAARTRHRHSPTASTRPTKKCR